MQKNIIIKSVLLFRQSVTFCTFYFVVSLLIGRLSKFICVCTVLMKVQRGLNFFRTKPPCWQISAETYRLFKKNPRAQIFCFYSGNINLRKILGNCNKTNSNDGISNETEISSAFFWET